MIIGLVITLVTLAISGLIVWKFVTPMLSSATTLMQNLSNSAAQRNALLATGAAANARVLSVQGTGSYINHAPQVVLDLEVAPSTGAQSFRARCVSIVSQLQIPQVQPGCVVPVRFDPMDPSRIALAI